MHLSLEKKSRFIWWNFRQVCLTILVMWPTAARDCNAWNKTSMFKDARQRASMIASRETGTIDIFSPTTRQFHSYPTPQYFLFKHDARNCADCANCVRSRFCPSIVCRPETSVKWGIRFYGKVGQCRYVLPNERESVSVLHPSTRKQVK